MPAGFMINYHMYRAYWPLMALGRYRKKIAGRFTAGLSTNAVERR
jgi:squalene cyclase